MICTTSMLGRWHTSLSALRRQICLQYMSAVWVHDDEQKQAADHMVQDLEKRYGKTLTTKIQPAQHWTAAEEYHQKVWTMLQHSSFALHHSSQLTQLLICNQYVEKSRKGRS